jgi:FRG domain
MLEIELKKKWDEFLDWINSTSTNYYFKGESNTEYLLRPKIGRNNYSLSDELNMFEHFILRTSLYINAKNDFEWLAIAQHHGLPTRLLDWSLNPLVACFFAVTSNINKNGRIYKVDSSKNDTIDIKKYNSPFEIDKIHFLHPPASTRRIELQKGLFSLHPLPKEPLLIGSRYLYGSDEKEILIEIENNYHFNEKPKPFFSAENYEYNTRCAFRIS